MAYDSHGRERFGQVPVVMLGGVEDKGKRCVDNTHKEEHTHKSSSINSVRCCVLKTNLMKRRKNCVHIHSQVHVTMTTSVLTLFMTLAAATSGELISRTNIVPIKKSPSPFLNPSY